MRITVIASGTRGDVQPLVALTKGLCQAGHAVRVATHHEFEPLVKAHGLEFFELRGNPSELIQMMSGGKNPIRLMRDILHMIGPLFEQGLTDVWEACQGSDAVILSMLGFYGGVHVAEKLTIPFFEGYVLPGRPTCAFSSPLMGSVNLRLGGRANRWSHVLCCGWRGCSYSAL